MLLKCSASLNTYAHEQLFKGPDRLLHGSTLADGRECISEYLRRIWFLCAMFAQIKPLFAETWAIGANLRMCWGQAWANESACTHRRTPFKICSMSKPIADQCFPLDFGHKDAIHELNLDSHSLEWVFPMWRTCLLRMLIMYKDQLDCFDLRPASKRWLEALVDEWWLMSCEGEMGMVRGIRALNWIVFFSEKMSICDQTEAFHRDIIVLYTHVCRSQMTSPFDDYF